MTMPFAFTSPYGYDYDLGPQPSGPFGTAIERGGKHSSIGTHWRARQPASVGIKS